LRVAIIHNLRRGGALRTVQEHEKRFGVETLEFCLQTATPVTGSAHIVPFAPLADRLPPALRPLPRHSDLATLLVAWRALTRAVREARCDVVLAHPCQFLQAPPALRWARTPTIYFCQEPRRVDYEPAAAQSINPRTRRLYGPLHRAERRVDRIGVAAADLLLTNSRFTAHRIRAAYGRTAEPVPLGVADVFRHSAPTIEPTHLLSVGGLLPSKGHDRAIQAASLTARRWPLVVVAPRAEPVEMERLRALAADRSVRLEIRLGISDEQLRELYRGAACTLYLAREEPFGLVSLEAQACGSPVVVANEGGLPETMLDNDSGWAIDRSDSAAVAHAIDLLEDDVVRRAVSARAREHGGAQSWERSTKRVEELLELAMAA
jgi:glycosyltransferase involved in cell wall biosynthesis